MSDKRYYLANFTKDELATMCAAEDARTDGRVHVTFALQAENAKLREESQSIGMAAYEVGYRDGSIHYELEHCPACKNIADLQEALEENAKLRELLSSYWKRAHSPAAPNVERNYLAEMRELGIEVPA